MEKDGRSERLAEIGVRVRQRRRELDLTQEQLAERAGLSKSFISEVEGGQAAASGLMYLRIAEALDGVSVEWLLQGDTLTLPGAGPTEVHIPPAVSALAEEMGWSHSETLDVAAALQTVVARRTRGKRWDLKREELIALANAVRALRPQAPATGKGKAGK